MILSRLSFTSNYAFDIHNEKDFETLALVAQDPGKKYITFINEKKYFSKLNENVSMVITKPELKEFIPDRCGIVVSDNPGITFFGLHNFLGTDTSYVRPSYKTVIGDGCRISCLASIAEKNVTIGNNVTIEEFVTIYPNTIIGDNVIIRSGVKIGCHGFEYKRTPDASVLSINHYGGVIIKHDSDIHCNTCIDRAVYPWDDTVIMEYSKIDNLVHIGHGVKIGKCLLIAANTTIGGRTIVGDGSWVGMGVTIKNAIRVGEKTSVNMGSVLANDLESGKEVSGNYAVDQDAFFFHQLKIKSKR